MENSEQNTQPTQIVTAYELAKCLPYLLRNSYVMPFEIDTNENHFRHFVINDPNK